MRVSYNGFTGDLVKLERKVYAKETSTAINAVYTYGAQMCYAYELSIYDSEKKATHSFERVKMEDVKFMGGEVSF